MHDPSTRVLDLPSAESPGPRVKGGSAMKDPIPRLVYVFVFECEACKRDISEHFQAEDPQSEFHLRCECGWKGTRSGKQAKRILCQVGNSRLPEP
jgi:hypothetical protein